MPSQDKSGAAVEFLPNSWGEAVLTKRGTYLGAEISVVDLNLFRHNCCQLQLWP